jgi:hypothetical protein
MSAPKSSQTQNRMFRASFDPDCETPEVVRPAPAREPVRQAGAGDASRRVIVVEPRGPRKPRGHAPALAHPRGAVAVGASEGGSPRRPGGWRGEPEPEFSTAWAACRPLPRRGGREEPRDLGGVTVVRAM